MNLKELKDLLKNYPDDTPIYLGKNKPVKGIIVIDLNKKPKIIFSDIDGVLKFN